MFNSFGWIKLGMNRIDTEMGDEFLQEKLDKLDAELNYKVKTHIEEITSNNPFVNFDFIDHLNNLKSFVSIQLSRNHFDSTLREFFSWIGENSDGSHGLLYEHHYEDPDYNPNMPYKAWRLVGKDFEECEEQLINEKYSTIRY